ncbi:MAG TPA: hypothetical protein DEF42_10380 [Desulfosporosinus sp.]|nr:hypothetical protein [Desulfosporosinus sp.]
MTEKPKKKINFFSPSLLISGVGMYIGFLFIFAWKMRLSVYSFLGEYGVAIFGFSIFGTSYFYLAYLVYTKILKRRASVLNFIDVDESSSKKKPNSSRRFQAQRIRNIHTIKVEACTRKTPIKKPTIESLNDYLLKLTSVIEEKADVSDKKASMLLDRGVKYSRNGIIFYIVSISIWQTLAWFKGLQVQFIYGIVSCSFLFIFIEFLSAWFLKQYRHFIDNSTYLIKVKSVFDKYMLTILALKELSNVKEISSESVNIIVDMLKEDIKWPDAEINVHNDISFAKEALESMTEAFKHVISLKSELHSNEKNEKAT